MTGIVVLVSGNGSNLEAIAEACYKNQINSNIINVISNNPDAFGIVRAKRLNIPHICIDHKEFSTRDDFDLSLMRHIEQFDPDLIILAGFMRILSKRFIRSVDSFRQDLDHTWIIFRFDPCLRHMDSTHGSVGCMSRSRLGACLFSSQMRV